VDPEGPGGKAGVLFGDVIVALENAPVGGVHDLQAFLDPEFVGKIITVSLIRGGQLVKVDVTIGERKRN
jgi:S1-C subfamily serine protease